jgi:hypothetical protein
MRSRTLLMSAALLPLVACFEVVIPEEPAPAPAELQEGEWMFDMEMVSADGDCWDMGIDVEDPYLYEYSAWAWIETHGDDGVSIDLEGFVLDGSIYGDELWAGGDMSYGYGYDYGDDDTPEPLEGEDSGEDDRGDETDEADDEPGYDPSSGGSSDAPADCLGGDGDAEILPICEDIEPYPEEESIFASLDADILSPDRMRGSIIVDYVYFDTYCSVEFAFEAEALDEDPCDCDCCCDDDPVPYDVGTGEASDGSEGGAPE